MSRRGISRIGAPGKALLREFQEKLIAKLNFTQAKVKDATQLLASRFEIATPVLFDKLVCRDPDDDVVLATALAGSCYCLITGDKDLLVLGCFRKIAIAHPCRFLGVRSGGRQALGSIDDPSFLIVFWYCFHRCARRERKNQRHQTYKRTHG